MSSLPIKQINPIDIPYKNTVTKRYQMKQNKVAFNLHNYTIKIAIKEGIDDSNYKLEPTDCYIYDEVNGRFSFEFTQPLTAEIFEGVFEMKLIDATGKEKTFAQGRFIITKTLIT